MATWPSGCFLAGQEFGKSHQRAALKSPRNGKDHPARTAATPASIALSTAGSGQSAVNEEACWFNTTNTHPKTGLAAQHSTVHQDLPQHPSHHAHGASHARRPRPAPPRLPWPALRSPHLEHPRPRPKPDCLLPSHIRAAPSGSFARRARIGCRSFRSGAFHSGKEACSARKPAQSAAQAKRRTSQLNGSTHRACSLVPRAVASKENGYAPRCSFPSPLLTRPALLSRCLLQR